jgi:malate permease and related proteins
MPYADVLNVVLPTFITIVIGYVVGKLVKIDMIGVVDLIFYIGLPALAFTSILSHQIILIEAAQIFAADIIVTLGCGLLAWLIFKIKRERHSGLYLPVMFPNTVNIPFPIISLAYGASGLFAATLYYIPNVILIYSLGIFIAAGRGWRANLINMLKVPTMYTAIIALLLNLNRIAVPTLIMRPLDFIGSMVTPAVVLTLGYSLSRIKVTSIFTTFLASLVRLGGGLAIGFLIVYVFQMTGTIRSVVILMSSMPGAVNTYLLAAKYKNEPELVASVVLVTTVASLIIIPFLLHTLT